MPNLPQQLNAEFIGTFALVFAAVGSAVSCGSPVSSELGLLGAALANGLVLTVIVAAFGSISGAHFNPAVTIALWIAGRAKPTQVVPYIATQVVAATLAALACKSMYPAEAIAETQLGLCNPAPWLTTPVVTVLLAEVIISFLLMIGIYGTVIDRRGKPFNVAGSIGVGAIVAANILAAGAVSGAAMNPARAAGPAIVQWDFNFHWCYWLAPCVGAIAAALLYERVLLDEPSDEQVEP